MHVYVYLYMCVYVCTCVWINPVVNPWHPLCVLWSERGKKSKFQGATSHRTYDATLQELSIRDGMYAAVESEKFGCAGGGNVGSPDLRTTKATTPTLFAHRTRKEKKIILAILLTLFNFSHQQDTAEIL